MTSNDDNSTGAARPSSQPVNVLVLGATGMLGHAVFRSLSQSPRLQVRGTVRRHGIDQFRESARADLLVVEDLDDIGRLQRLFATARPDVVVNCVSVRKPVPADPMRSIALLSLLPQRLSVLCQLSGARLVQISSDGVFAGTRGGYTEDDLPDATDTYGIAKMLGEVRGLHAVTLRTSIIGHELRPQGGLLEWFLAQSGSCRCYTRAIFSGLPTAVLARIVRDLILPRPDLHGIYHVAADPISKFDLLRLVAQRYGKAIELVPDDSVVLDRSLRAARFAAATGYTPPAWPELVDAMFRDHSDFTRT